MAPSTPTPSPFAAMRNFGGMVSSALSFGDRSRQVSSLGLGTLSLGEPSGAASPPRSASPPAGSPSPVSGSRVPVTGSPGGPPPAATPRRRTPAFRPDREGRIDSEGEDELEEYPDDDVEVFSVEDNNVDSPESVPAPPPAQIVGQKRRRSLSSSSCSSSSSSSGVLPPANAIAAAAAAVAAPPLLPEGSLRPNGLVVGSRLVLTKRVIVAASRRPSAPRPSVSRPSAPRPSSPVVPSPPAHGTRSRCPSAPPATPVAAPVTASPASKKTPKSSLKKSKGKRVEKEVVFEAGDVEDEATQRAGPSVPRLSFVHPRISLDPRIPEDEKEFATYRSLVLGLTTQLDVARRDTSLLLDFSTRQANALNNLTAALVDVVNGGNLNEEARTRWGTIDEGLRGSGVGVSCVGV
ncbi:hypothetical protein TREMEDRAFT_61345 [Tremella mesenterica DSM 1558]|uniref:uncharacterized protein n=1 Tax=Tremella mesenterica (strain ATCC 24925 / CBS 8224 / DSM 1558 / NBRC 9311 / NRRL Y-6157 / RJB 2259-6 / UBC 559-6) TaxID=578456 RepID=UPI0003F48C1E|nr:uncharacterized protein TREMEDRAFT_61345 [Tremella mesenterica DSM 1558]EIW70837.1 hypothetical protein TREMEDRAFT_61345 [Tremella mesenterica DSM 1558]